MRLVMAGLVVSLLTAVPVQAQAPEPVDDQFQVNSYTTDDQRGSLVAGDTEGNFVVVWGSDGSYGTDSTGFSIQGQLYDASGTRVGSQFQVNSYTTSSQSVPAVATDGEGNFAVTWSSLGSYGTDTSGLSIQGQLYDAFGTRVDGEFQVNSFTTSHQATSRLAMDAQGRFVVVWHSTGSYGTDSSSHSTQGQRYDASGTPVGPQFQVNSYTTDQQYRVKVVSGSDGNFVVVWETYGSDGTDTSYLSVQGLRLTPPIFTDGFESGDTSAWSSRVQ